jgi:hypothetical protein
LKNVKDLVSEDFEFYEAEDIGIQTSFDMKVGCQTGIDSNLTNTSIDCESQEISNKNNQNTTNKKEKSIDTRYC